LLSLIYARSPGDSFGRGGVLGSDSIIAGREYGDRRDVGVCMSGKATFFFKRTIQGFILSLPIFVVRWPVHSLSLAVHVRCDLFLIQVNRYKKQRGRKAIRCRLKYL